MKKLVYELKGKVDADTLVIIGFDASKPHTKPAVRILINKNDNVFELLEGLNGRIVKQVCAS